VEEAQGGYQLIVIGGLRINDRPSRSGSGDAPDTVDVISCRLSSDAEPGLSELVRDAIRPNRLAPEDSAPEPAALAARIIARREGPDLYAVRLAARICSKTIRCSVRGLFAFPCGHERLPEIGEQVAPGAGSR
jgi:hypothetical protein